jgi:hypothetical protein
MSQGAGIWTRIVAGLHGEVSAEALKGYRRAGTAVYDLLDRVQRQREEQKVSGCSPWDADRGLQFQVAFAWNAFVLQTLGDELMEAAGEASMVGFLPRVTAEQVKALYSQVEPWISRANQAASNPDYVPDVHLPAELPGWVEVEPCPRAHLVAMVAALKAIKDRAAVAVGAFREDRVPHVHARRYAIVQQRLAGADTAAEYALDLWADDLPQRLYEDVEKHIRAALEGYYLAGQMLAMPELVPSRRGERAMLDPTPPRPADHRKQVERSMRIGPGRPGFNRWCLTDPDAARRLRQESGARTAVRHLWRYDPDPQETLMVQYTIEAALARGDIERTAMHYHRCPWASVYLVKRPVWVGGKKLLQLQQFTFDVSAEGTDDGRPFTREILVSTFEPTGPVDDGDRD